ncbi:unnamed protein product [Rotaria sordida]|uniref:ubiquitinyl hydrolase 1 n=1 Tax=Rotaria sordida TaxID=392033 RepID=A0A815G5H6_9BILA|nr:unnamed protein product [Rotaria sordida]CAF1593358.1 unnamed protein product [Rotaria sordida]
MNKFKLDNSDIYQHLCLELTAYLNNHNSNETSGLFSGVNNYEDFTNVNQTDHIPSYDELTKKWNYTIGISLTRMEIWVESCVEQWINHPSLFINGKNRFEILLRFYEDYQSVALNHYYSEKGPTDPMGYSRFILTSLTIIRSMHRKLCSDPRFERLKLHSIHIPNLMNLFEFLILPNQEDMIRVRSLYDYFSEFNQKQYPDILTNIESENAFGVYFANQIPGMNESVREIRAQAERDKQQKIIEVNNAKERYRQLMNSISGRSCQCYYNEYNYIETCYRCRIQQQANDIQVHIYECPLPLKQERALAVIFELQMPIEIRNYRDIIWQFANRPNPHPQHNMYEWLSVPPHASKLGPYYTGPNNTKVKLVSPTKSVTQTHYSSPSIASASVNDFLYENSLQVQISSTKPISFEDECRILTPQLDHSDYKQLQFTVNTTQFVQNHVIAKLSDCPPRLKSTQFVEFGSFRSGHRLQWWNLLTIFEMDSLSIAEESVVILIIHSILQYGPLTADSRILSNTWCPESHEQLLEDHFVDELVSRLDHHLDDCELNWQNELVLVVITMITMRLLTICKSTRVDQTADLAMKCRRVGEKWINLITESIQTISSSAFHEMEKLRLKIVNVGISCLLTFSTHKDRISCLLSSNEHVISLLKAATTVHDNIILNKNQSNMSIFMKNMMRLSERILVMIQPTLAEFLQKTSYQSLNEFAAIYWAVIKRKGNMNGEWQKRKKDSHDGWYDCRYESKYISIDCIRGTFLVDDITIGFLPEKITTNELFVRVFGYHIFEAQAAEAPNTYITKHLYHGDGRVQYEFHFNDQTNRLTINERHIHKDEMFQLIPHKCFQTELPDTFVSDHSHWWNAKDQIVEFRPVHFKDADFLDNKPYVLSLTTGHITTTEAINRQILVNQSSTFFDSMFNRYFIRLDDKPYVYMMRDNSSSTDIIIHIRLSRLGIAFKYNGNSNIITSREYSDMCIDENQWLGTLTGLQSGLVLSPSSVNNQKLEHYPYRKLIVPFGQLHAQKTSDYTHQTVIIQRISESKDFLRHYFVFIMNDRLRILQSTDSPTGWLYLALLHAMTSHPLPDQYTGMTGMERAFQLLNSAGCWSDQPFDALSLNILAQIAAISPKVNYYPEHLTCMEKIEWHSNGLPYSMQHFSYYLIAKRLIETSQQLNFMYTTSVAAEVPKLFEGKLYNERLLKKLYWDYRDSYNPLARLSTQMEADITRYKKSYQSPVEHCSHETNYGVVRLVDDLYNNGNVRLKDCSKQHWLPLSQWLTDENQLKTTWIGLLKMVDYLKTSTTDNRRDEIKRFEMLIDFLHYIFNKLQIKPFYLQMLKTALKMPTILSTFVTFPQFICYQNTEEISVVRGRINLSSYYNSYKRNQIIAQIENCFWTDSNYEDRNELTTSTEKAQINQLLKSWQNNRQLRSFLESVQSCICSVTIEKFDIKISYYPQQFALELFQDHHRIQIRSANKSIDQELLRSTEQKFHHSYSGHFNKPTVSVQTADQKNTFPQAIFPSINNQDNPLSEITNYFQNQLAESWNKLLLDKHTQKEDPSIEEIAEFLKSLQEESTKFWNEFVEPIRLSNERLFNIGLVTRITPATVMSVFQEQIVNSVKSLSFVLTTDQRTLLGGILVNWTLEQQLERALHFAIHDKWEDFKKEISHRPHSNWIPSEHVPWLILELEMNITIREIQIKVANHMMKPNMTTDNSTVKSIVMQMNMGEGKTSVILPMLTLSLCSSSSSLVRIVVLKSLFSVNYQSLRYKLGGLLNRRVFPFACRRDMNFTNEQIKQIFNRLQQGLHSCDVILTSPEDILSFDLLTIDKCRRNEFDTSRSMLTIQRWLKTYARDVLDESDEILHVKYQLIYTVGGQQQVDGGAERWKTIQSILELEVCYKSAERKSAFPQFRLQSHQPFPQLCQNIANDWINNRNYRHANKQIILSFILKTNSSVENLNNKFSDNDIQLFLIIRGLLSSEVLLIAFKKRHRVNYGVNPNIYFNRLMAVPFRAKDIVADRTEFGHPDVALVLTHLSYYYSGLNDEQLTQCFNRLIAEETDPASIYDQWILYEKDDDIPTNIKQWKGVNLIDYQQRTQYLFPTFRYNILVINYFLNYFVFPREAKQFPHKLISSAWDLSSSARSKIITGFSGTNDTQLLLPIHILQYDLSELQKTDAIVVNNLLQAENENYQFLPINATSNEILNQIVKHKERINVILDVGALFIDGNNQDIAIKWLHLSDKNKIDYAVYFDSDSIIVCDRQFHHHRFEISPASERLDRCVCYLDEIHTRGTDFKFPKGFRAALTLGNGLTKDRFVQAAMRMRKLGNGHSLTFWSSYEVHQQITQLKKNSSQENINNFITLIDILRWVYENTVHSTWNGLHHWAAQSLSFQRKVAAFRNILWTDHHQLFTDTMMEELARECLEPEIIGLIRMYGAPKVLQTLFEIHSARYELNNDYLSREIQETVLKRLKDYGGTKQRLSQLLDEEQQRELEQELEEERQLARPPPVKPCQPILHERIKRLCDTHSNMMNLLQFPLVFHPLVYAFNDTTFYSECQPNSWHHNFWVSTDIQRVIATKGESRNPFLRPPRWIVVYRNQHIIFISAFEANWLIGRLRSNSSPITTLRLLLPRVKRVQSIFANTPTLTIPPSIRLSNNVAPFIISFEWLAQLFIFNGTLYFETVDEQTAYCQCLGLCPKPRTTVKKEAFEKGWIGVDGFVSNPVHRHHLQINQARFAFNPLTFVKQIIENRTNSHAPISSHVGSIIFNSFKLI